MAIQTRKNQYQGLNAHHLSALQRANWEGFHAPHITHLRDHIEALLPLGYLARSEESLQVVAHNLVSGVHTTYRTRPDISIFSRENRPAQPAYPAPAATQVLPLESLILEDEETLNAIVIYEIQGRNLGRPVARIELLSPANKPPTHQAYIRKRSDTLKSGVLVVEIDYLHESPSLLSLVSDSTDYPYGIYLCNPHPDVNQVYAYQFRVDDPVPSITLPLLAGDTVRVDFGAVYNYTFEHDRYSQLIVDYEQLPERFERYSPLDQQRIQRRMATIQAAYQAGQDLDALAPLPLPDAEE